jgi:hypothetical protein
MPGIWRKCRTTLRWCRFTLWAVLLLGLCLLYWLNQLGLPGFVKTRLVGALQDRGVQLEFSRMHLSFARGIIADNVRIGNLQTNGSAVFTARQMRLELDLTDLLRGRWQVDGLIIRDGNFQLAGSSAPSFNPASPPVFALTNLQSELAFQANDTWSLSRFQAGFEGVEIVVTGTIAHATEIKDWQMFQGHGNTGKAGKPGPGALTGLLQNISNTAARFHFTGQPVLELTVSGDARDVHSVSARLNVEAAGVSTPWFSARDLRYFARLTAPADAPTNADPALGFWTNLQPFRLEWLTRAGEVQVGQMEGDAFDASGEWRAPRLEIRRLSAQMVEGRLQAAAGLDIVQRRLTFTNDSSFDPHLLDGFLTPEGRAQLTQILWTQPPSLRLGGFCVLPAWTNAAPAWRDEIAPTIQMAGELVFSNAVIANTTLELLRARFECTNQLWKLSDLELAHGRTRLKFQGDVDETTQRFAGHLRGMLATESVRLFAGTNLAGLFNRFQFSRPLALDVAIQGNGGDWRTLSATGGVTLADFSVATSPVGHLDVDRLQAHFHYTDQTWTLTDLQLAQGRTQLEASGTGAVATGDFQARVRGDFDVNDVRAFLPTRKAVAGFDFVNCRQPLALNVAAAGNWHDWASLTATGRVALTNFSIHAQAVDDVSGNFFYTNRQLQFFHPYLSRDDGRQTMTADVVRLDLEYLRIYFTNGFSTAAPLDVARAIGPQTGELLEPYRFLGLPDATVNGCAPMHDVDNGRNEADADLTFTLLKPVPFQTGKIRTPRLLGTVRWFGQRLIVTNITADLYGGKGRGFAYFDFSPAHPGADFKYRLAMTNVDLHYLIMDLSDPSNQLQGRVSGEVMVTNADTETWRSWNGYGNAQLRNGLLWNVPVFGLVSATLNLFSPGLGNSQATDATARFVITNGVIYSDTMEMHTPTMQLRYVGTVDLEQNVNALVMAHLLRNTPLLGPLISTIFTPVSKFFECRVTGQLSDPKVTPVYLPSRLLLAPLHPIRSVQEMFVPTTNAPALPPGGRKVE